MKLLRTYWRDRLHWVALVYANTLLVLLVGALLLQLRGYNAGLLTREAGYLLLLTTFLLLLFAGFDLMRWWPYAAQQQRLLEGAAEADALTNLPEGGTGDQRAGAALLRKLHGRFAAERAAHLEAHQRQLSFLHLWVHQMKTPVSLISLMAQRDPAMTTVGEQAEKISEGLDLVLTMARLDHFAGDYQIRRVDLTSLVREVVGARRKQFIRLGIFPQLAVQTDNATLLTDAKWLSFAIDQVVSNALKYGAQAGKESQTLRLTIRKEGKLLHLTVADEGPGIPPEDLPRVFEPFFTGENGRRYAGATGVGLWLVKRVMDELGHTVALTSSPGQGTTVQFSFVTEP